MLMFNRVFKVGMSCIDEFKDQCLNQRQKLQMERAVAGAQHTFAFLCDDPVFQSGKWIFFRIICVICKCPFEREKKKKLFLMSCFSVDGSVQNFCNIRAVSMARPTIGNAALIISRSPFNHFSFVFCLFLVGINGICNFPSFYLINYSCSVQGMVAEEIAANITKADRNLGLCW